MKKIILNGAVKHFDVFSCVSIGDIIQKTNKENEILFRAIVLGKNIDNSLTVFFLEHIYDIWYRKICKDLFYVGYDYNVVEIWKREDK